MYAINYNNKLYLHLQSHIILLVNVLRNKLEQIVRKLPRANYRKCILAIIITKYYNFIHFSVYVY